MVKTIEGNSAGTADTQERDQQVIYASNLEGQLPAAVKLQWKVSSTDSMHTAATTCQLRTVLHAASATIGPHALAAVNSITPHPL